MNIQPGIFRMYISESFCEEFPVVDAVDVHVGVEPVMLLE
jgi:hypothetical protein